MSKTSSPHPYHPIVYVRGFAATQGEIEETVADPYMGFNIGSTKARVAWTGDVKRFFFESPLVRLMSEHEYEDVFVEGDDLVAAERTDHPVPYRCIVIYRYYDEASQVFGDVTRRPSSTSRRGWAGSSCACATRSAPTRATTSNPRTSVCISWPTPWAG